MSINTGGPAFPTNDGQAAHAIGAAAVAGVTDPAERDRLYAVARGQAMQGMTLRDYFAAHALGTVTAYATADVETWEPSDFAKHAYVVADAMLAARGAA